MPRAGVARTDDERVELLLAERLRLHRIEPSRPLRSVDALADFVRDRRVVLETGKASVAGAAHAIAGREISGSWMAAPEVHLIYDILTELEKHDFVYADLVGGKTTILDPSLGPALAAVAADPERRTRAVATLPPAAAKLLAAVESDGEVWMDRFGLPTKEGRTARALLQRLFLVTTSSVHTERGNHRAVVRPWARSNLAERHGSAGNGMDPARAADEVLTACLHSAVVAPEREAQKWFDVAGEALDRLLASGQAERLAVGRSVLCTLR